MDVARCVAICGGSVSFKFKIGETVKRKAPDSAEHFKVVSLLLSGYVKVRSLDTHYPTINTYKQGFHYEVQTFTGHTIIALSFELEKLENEYYIPA
jgi:hypothetical protein